MSRSAEYKMLDLIDDYFNRDLSIEEMDVLNGALQEDQALQQLFADRARDELVLHKALEPQKQRRLNFSIPHKSQRRIQRIAALITVVLTIGVIYVAQRAPLPTSGIASVHIADVVDMYALKGHAVTAVNAGYIRKINSASELRTGDLITVPRGGRLSYKYLADETVVIFEAGTTFELVKAEGAKHILLHDGTMLAHVEKQPMGKPMIVRTDDAEIEVLGTVFELAARQLTRLTVRSGQVAMTALSDGERVVVDSGFSAVSNGRILNIPEAIKWLSLIPVWDTTLNMTEDNNEFIAVDPKRNFKGMLEFDLGAIQGRILEAKLKLRVMKHLQDYGGDGTVRLYVVDPEAPDLKPDSSAQIAHYTGKVGGGMDLEFDLDPAALTSGKNGFLLVLDDGGNDFWFSSSEGAEVPQLNLRIAENNK